MLARPDYDRMLSLFDDEALRAIENMVEAESYLSQIRKEIAVLGPGIIKLLDSKGVKIRSAGSRAKLLEVSRTVKNLGISLPPGTQGVFIPFDRALYILEPEAGVCVHEMGHAIDFAMIDPKLPEDFDSAKLAKMNNAEVDAYLKGYQPFRTLVDQEFLNNLKGTTWAPSAYGATSPQEFFAEAVRAYCNVNDTGSLWDEISAPKFRCMNRPSYGLLLSVFHHYNGRKFEKWRHYDGERVAA